MAESTRLRILCFGDSLTAGYSGLGSSYHPYEEKLVEKLEEAIPGLKVETAEDGLPGDLTQHFTSRLEEHYPRKGLKRSYDWAIFLGGTNDLAYQFSPEQIFENLEKSWSLALGNKAKVLALTVPEAGIKPSAQRTRLEARRNRLNALIKGYTRTGFHCMDFHAAMPYFALSEEDRKRYWDDNIHFTPDGYDLMGEKIAEALIPLIRDSLPEQQGDFRRSKRRRVFKDDHNDFTEEDGDSDTIESGYVVVRRKDLE